MQNYNFVGCYTRVCHLFWHNDEGIEAEGVGEEGAEESNGPEKDEGAEERRRVHSEDFHDFCSPPNIICMIKSRRMGQL